MSMSLMALSVSTLQNIRHQLASSVAQMNDAIRNIDLAIDDVSKQKNAAAAVAGVVAALPNAGQFNPAVFGQIK